MSKNNLKSAIQRAVQTRTKDQPAQQPASATAGNPLAGLSPQQLAALTPETIAALFGRSATTEKPAAKKEKLPPKWVFRVAEWATTKDTWEIVDLNAEREDGFNRSLIAGKPAKFRQLLDAFAELQDEISKVID